MKKLSLFLVSLLLLLAAGAPAALAAAEASVQASINNETGLVTISGSISTGSGQSVTVQVQSPSGNIDYIDQTVNGAGGSYQFSYYVLPGRTGLYRVSVGGAGVDSPAATTFEYTGPGQSGGSGDGPQSPGGNNGGGESEVGTVAETKDGAKWEPGSKYIVRQTKPDGTTEVHVSFDRDVMEQMLGLLDSGNANAHTLTIATLEGDDVRLELTAEALRDTLTEQSNIVITLQTPYGSYELPLSALHGKVDPGASVIISIAKAGGEVDAAIAEGLSGDAAAKALKFTVWTVMNGETREIRDFGRSFISREIVVPGKVNPELATGVLYDPETNTLHFAPTVFRSEEGRTVAEIKRNGNSIYTVIELQKTFDDITGSWAKNDIEVLASKLIVNGKSEPIFAPGGKVTRAEFAAMLVRSFGLSSAGENPSFDDVQATDWHAGAVATAAYYGLINGYDEHTFRPDRTITREEMAVMVARALAFAGYGQDGDALESVLEDKFADYEAISPWAREAIGTAVRAKILTGVTETEFVPKRDATRAEAAVMLRRLLQHVEFIN